MKSLLIPVLLLLVTFLNSCGGSSVQTLSARIEKQIVPKAPSPGYTSDAVVTVLPNGDLLYLNEGRYDKELIISRYSDTLGVRWENTILMMDDRDERVDWNALQIGNDSISVFSTLNKKDDSAHYYARMVSLNDGGNKGPMRLCSYPVDDESEFVVKAELTDMVYDRIGGRDMMNAYHSPDKKTFLVTTYKHVEDAKDIDLTFRLFSRDLRQIKEAKLKVLLTNQSGEAQEVVIAALPTNAGDVLIATFDPKSRKLRFLRYALSGDGHVTELSHTFEAIKGFEDYSFKFAPLSGNTNKLYIGTTVLDPPAAVFSSGHSEFGAFYLGTVDFDQSAVKFSKYAPTSDRLESMIGTGEIEDVNLKSLYIDEVQDRIVAVLEESMGNTSTHVYRPMVGPRSTGQGNSVSRTTYQANNILLVAFDMKHNLVWERGIHNKSWDYDDLYLGCMSARTNNTLSLWYPTPSVLQYHEFDFATGQRLNNKTLLAFDGMFFLSPFSMLDKNNNMYFLAQDGRMGSDSFLFKIRPN